MCFLNNFRQLVTSFRNNTFHKVVFLIIIPSRWTPLKCAVVQTRPDNSREFHASHFYLFCKYGRDGYGRFVYTTHDARRNKYSQPRGVKHKYSQTPADHVLCTKSYINAWINKLFINGINWITVSCISVPPLQCYCDHSTSEATGLTMPNEVTRMLPYATPHTISFSCAQ